MDRRQRKTRESIFSAFTHLLSQMEYSKITVGQIISYADIGRATFYAHFETKDFLLKALCEELFCHIFDAAAAEDTKHKHIFQCQAPDSVFLHLFQHLFKNDNNILTLLSGQNNELFLRYFREGLTLLVKTQRSLFASPNGLPEDFWLDHIVSTFVQTLKWWVTNGTKESPETITEYFLLAV